ncbi:hypothetical protein N431DRAFT_144336 [Stipitochalara longipes BDJ]|nr:hypothetical protein N431DRAFT_144336 [Stipitochalara longipes BDJ]
MDADMIVSLREEYQLKQEVSRAPQFRGGIDAIFALGRCLNVVSDPRAALVPMNIGEFKLGAIGNEQDRLPVKVHDCANVGLTTFVETQKHMEHVKTKAQALMLQSGPINKIIGCLHKNPSTFNTQRMEAQQEIITNSVNSMRTSLDKIEKEWTNWEDVVDDLSRRSEHTEVDVADAQEETKKQIGATQLKLAEGQKQMEEFKSQLDELSVQQRQMEIQYQQSLNKHPNGNGKDRQLFVLLILTIN